MSLHCPHCHHNMILYHSNDNHLIPVFANKHCFHERLSGQVGEYVLQDFFWQFWNILPLLNISIFIGEFWSGIGLALALILLVLIICQFWIDFTAHFYKITLTIYLKKRMRNFVAVLTSDQHQFELWQQLQINSKIYLFFYGEIEDYTQNIQFQISNITLIK